MPAWHKTPTLWFAIVSGVGSLVALWWGLAGNGPGPQWFWVVVAYIALAIALIVPWMKDHKRLVYYENQTIAEFREQVARLCRDQIQATQNFRSDTDRNNYFFERIRGDVDLIKKAVEQHYGK